MTEYPKLHRGEDGSLYYPDLSRYEPMFPIEHWDSPEAFNFAGVKGYAPMLASEIPSEEVQEEELSKKSNIIEEKFDGTRGIVQFFSQPGEDDEPVGYCRVFSRRVSKKTGFFVENTDSVPQIRDIDVPELAGTVLDGEMFINGLPFKEVSSTLNCKWDKAIERQSYKGYISLHVFDILRYKDIDLRRCKLSERKKFLKQACEEINSPYIEFVPAYMCGDYLQYPDCYARVSLSDAMTDRGQVCNQDFIDLVKTNKDFYPELYRCVSTFPRYLTPRAYYELIVLTGGEGVIVKPLAGKYTSKRGKEYLKIKKFLTREVIIIGFTKPTMKYEGKFPKDRWPYWIMFSGEKTEKVLSVSTGENTSAKQLLEQGYTPVNRFYYYGLIGTIRYGVIITDEEIKKLPKNKKFNIEEIELEGKTQKVIEIGECSGFDDETRELLSNQWKCKDGSVAIVSYNKDWKAWSKLHNNPDWDRVTHVGEVIEIKSNEIFRDTGKLRHPRFLRFREDKSPLSCTWKDHIL